MDKKSDIDSILGYASSGKTLPMATFTRGWRGPEQTEVFAWLVWRWNVDRAKQIVAGRMANTRVTVAEAYAILEANLHFVDTEHAFSEAVSTSEPPIGIVHRFGGRSMVMLIDGWHRVWRAHHEALDTIAIHLLSAEEEKQARLEGAWELVSE